MKDAFDMFRHDKEHQVSNNIEVNSTFEQKLNVCGEVCIISEDEKEEMVVSIYRYFPSTDTDE